MAEVGMRVGQGFDVHRYSDDPERTLVLGGVRFEGERGLHGHSDADVVAHACIEALLAAAGLPDIGQFFSDTDPAWAGADSLDLLRRAAEAVREAGWDPVNVSCSAVLDSPRLAPHREVMQERLGAAAGAPVTVTGRRSEGVGALGRGEGWPPGRWLWWPGGPAIWIGPVPANRRSGSRRPRSGPKPPSRSRSPAGRPQGARSSGKDRGGLGGEQVEGRQAVRELLLAGRRRTRTVMLARGLDPAPIIEHIVELAREQRAAIREVSRSELDATARTESPQGVVALADPLPEVDLAELVESPSAGTTGSDGRPAGAPFLLALDGITDPGNFGAVLRTAECAGVTGVVLPRHRSARVTPTVAKAAAGAVEHLRFAVVPGIPSALRTLSRHDVWTVGLDAAGPRPLHELELSGEAVALVLGSEGRGLSRLVAQRCDVLASIPLRGVLGSLNVAAAAAVACFEIARHR